MKVINAVVINGSPNMEDGYTALLLDPFIKGMEEAGAQTRLIYTSRMNIEPCDCGKMYCWYEEPGICCVKDEMQTLYPLIAEADYLVLGTPVYNPLPGKMQDLINRLCPLIEPYLMIDEKRTRARFRKHVHITGISMLSTGGWWECANFDTVIRIVEEMAKNAGVQFNGAVIRPHAFLMKKGGELTSDGQDILDYVRRAGIELIRDGVISRETIEHAARSLISEEDLRKRYNRETEILDRKRQ